MSSWTLVGSVSTVARRERPRPGFGETFYWNRPAAGPQSPGWREYLLPALVGPADLLPQGVDLLQGRLHLLLSVPQLPRHLLLLGAELGHALVELRELLQGQLPLLVGVLQFPGLGLQPLGSFNQLLNTESQTRVTSERLGCPGTGSEALGAPSACRGLNVADNTGDRLQSRPQNRCSGSSPLPRPCTATRAAPEPRGDPPAV